MTTTAPRQRRRGNGRSAPPTDPLALVRDDRLRGLVERLDAAADVIKSHDLIGTRNSKVTVIDHRDLDDIASAIEDAADVLAELRITGRLP
jgi:hypothetical protein